MHRDDGAGFAGDNGFFHPLWVQQQRLSVDIDERHAKATIESGRGAGDKRKVRHDDLSAVFEAIVIQHRCEPDAERVSAVPEQQPIPAATITRPLLSKLFGQRLRQTFDAAKEYAAKHAAHLGVPTREIPVLDGGPGTQSNITHGPAAKFGKFAVQPRGGWRHPAERLLRDVQRIFLSRLGARRRSWFMHSASIADHPRNLACNAPPEADRSLVM